MKRNGTAAGVAVPVTNGKDEVTTRIRKETRNEYVAGIVQVENVLQSSIKRF